MSRLQLRVSPADADVLELVGHGPALEGISATDLKVAAGLAAEMAGAGT